MSATYCASGSTPVSRPPARRGRIGGRPKALAEGDLKKARALLCSGEYTKVQVAKELAVSRHTLWRALAQEAAT